MVTMNGFRISLQIIAEWEYHKNDEMDTYKCRRILFLLLLEYPANYKKEN